jgi:hypothetical protein
MVERGEAAGFVGKSISSAVSVLHVIAAYSCNRMVGSDLHVKFGSLEKCALSCSACTRCLGYPTSIVAD